MARYLILREERSRPGSAGIGRVGAGGVRRMGAGGAPALKLEVDDLSPEAAKKVAARADVRLAARSMPTRLIKPLDRAPAGEGTSWGIAAVKADGSIHSGKGAVVAVLDTGIDKHHPAFAGVDLLRKNFAGGSEDDTSDNNGHGTHCAGTILGRDVGGERIGVARGVSRALIGKVLADDGSGTSEMIFDALDWAAQNGANIISMSLGFDFPGMVKELIDEDWPADLATSMALEEYRNNLRWLDLTMGRIRSGAAFGRDAIIVAASGNESRRQQDRDYRLAASLPAAAEGVISVGAVGEAEGNYDIADFSNSLPTLAAPGVAIKSAWPGGGLHTISGTSMACPHVAGVAALWWEALSKDRGRATVKNVGAQLIASARRDVFKEGVDDADVGDGLVTAP